MSVRRRLRLVAPGSPRSGAEDAAAQGEDSVGTGDGTTDYAVRSETRHEHLAELRRLYGFRSFSGGAARELGDRLREEAEQAQSNEDLVRRFVEACRLPATTTIERLCADALVDAERRIEARIAERVPPGLRRNLEHLLEETADAGVTRFVWLRQFEPGSNSVRRRQPAAGPPRAPPAPRCSGRPLPRDPSAPYAVAPAGGALLRRRAPRAPGQSPPRDSRGLRRRVGDVPRRCGGGDPRPGRRQNVSRSRPCLRSAARGRDGRPRPSERRPFVSRSCPRSTPSAATAGPAGGCRTVRPRSTRPGGTAGTPAPLSRNRLGDFAGSRRADAVGGRRVRAQSWYNAAPAMSDSAFMTAFLRASMIVSPV